MRLALPPLPKDKFLRTAQCLVLSMRAANPATGTAHAFLEFRAHPIDMFLTLLRTLHRDGPADPLIAGKRRDVLPFYEGFGIGSERSF